MNGHTFSKWRQQQNNKNALMIFKNLPLQNHWDNVNQTWHKSSLGKGDSNLFILFKWKYQPNSENTLTTFKNLLRSTQSQSILRWWDFRYAQMKDYALFQGEIIKKQQVFKKKIISRTNGPISAKLSKNTLVCEGLFNSEKGDNCGFFFSKSMVQSQFGTNLFIDLNCF